MIRKFYFSITFKFIFTFLLTMNFIIPSAKSNFHIDIDELINNLVLYDVDQNKFNDIFESEKKDLNYKVELSENFKELDKRIQYIMFKSINQMMKPNVFPLFFNAVLKFGLSLKILDENYKSNTVCVDILNLDWDELIEEVSFKKEHALELDFDKNEILKIINKGEFYECDYYKERNEHFALKLIDTEDFEDQADDSEIGIDKYISQRIIALNTDWDQKKIDMVNIVNFSLHCLGKVIFNYLIQKIDCEKAISLFYNNDIGLKTNNLEIEKELQEAKKNKINYFINYLALYILLNAGKETCRLKNVEDYGCYDIEDMVFDCANLVSFKNKIEVCKMNTKCENVFCYDSNDALLSYEAMYDDNQYFYELFVSAFGLKIFENNWGKAYRNLLIKIFGESSLGEMGLDWN